MLRINWKWGLMAVWLLLPAAGCLWLDAPARESWSGFRRYFMPRDADRSEAEIAADIAHLRQAGEQLAGEAAGGLREVPAGGAHAAIYDSLNARALKFGVSVLQIKPQPPQPQNGFQVLLIELRIESEFTRLLRFLDAVEQENTGLRIQALTLQPAQPAGVAAALTVRAVLR